MEYATDQIEKFIQQKSSTVLEDENPANLKEDHLLKAFIK